MKEQPISNIVWVHRDSLSGNLYNPNKVAPPEFELLKTSILSDGWLAVITVLDKSIHIAGLTDNPNLEKYTIIDGWHRYLLSGDVDVYALTGGMVPVVVLSPDNPMATTIRMNRAKGTHGVVKMGDILKILIEEGMPIQEIMQSLGMEKEEVIRLSNRMGIHQSKIVIDTEWSQSWAPKK